MTYDDRLREILERIQWDGTTITQTDQAITDIKALMGEPVAWLLQARTPADHPGQDPGEWETEDVSLTRGWTDTWLGDPRGDTLRAVPLYAMELPR